MKKLTFFFLLLSSLLAIWNCGSKPTDVKQVSSVKFISLADIALLAKIRGSDSNKAVTELMQEISVLHRLDGELRSQINNINREIQDRPKAQAGVYDILVAARAVVYADPGCCACGTGCCMSCGGGGGSDTTAYTMTVGAVKELTSFSLSPNASAGIVIQSTDSLKSVRLYNLDMSKPGMYNLTINTSLRPEKPISMQVEIQNNKFVFH